MYLWNFSKGYESEVGHTDYWLSLSHKQKESNRITKVIENLENFTSLGIAGDRRQKAERGQECLRNKRSDAGGTTQAAPPLLCRD